MYIYVQVVISPMYTIRSLLPCEASVVIETPELKSTKSVTVSGRGAAQDLDCPGLSESLHQLTFQLELVFNVYLVFVLRFGDQNPYIFHCISDCTIKIVSHKV